MKTLNIEQGTTKIKESEYIATDYEVVIIPDTVIEIDNNAFRNCRKLKTVIIPEGVKRIGRHAFWGCENLENVELPNSITKIEDGAFAYCSSLKRIIIPDNIAEIKKYAFFDCSCLKQIILSESIVKIGDYVFDKCNELAYVDYLGTQEQYKAIEFGDNSLPTVFYYETTYKPTLKELLDFGYTFLQASRGLKHYKENVLQNFFCLR